MSRVYYNEFDRRKAASLRNLIEEGLIADGVVDERSISEVQPEDLRGFDQHHFFAGIGIWSLCLRRAGWPDDRPVWTGSCPCGPFSEAGKGLGFDDPRHLWPEWFRLIRECRPDRVFGEQSANAVQWIDLVSGDMEGIGYAIGTPDIPAAGFGGAHKRQRFGFVADADNAQWWSDRAPWHDGQWPKTGRVESSGDLGYGGTGISMGDASGERYRAASGQVCARRSGTQLSGRPFGLGDTDRNGSSSIGRDHGQMRGFSEAQRQSEHGTALLGRSGPSLHLAHTDSDGRAEGSRWRSIRAKPDPEYGGGPDWVFCRDGLWRPVEPGLSPLADADSCNVGLLHGFGVAIDVETFTNLIGAYMDAAPPERSAA
nr:DNA cytosine methyltransferase [uncultured Brevundimonas sp.]